MALEPEGERGQEALSLLAEVYNRTGDSKGLYRASLKLARKADPATAEVLYRRARTSSRIRRSPSTRCCTSRACVPRMPPSSTAR